MARPTAAGQPPVRAGRPHESLEYEFHRKLLLDTTFDKLSEELAAPNYLAGAITIDMYNELERVHQLIHDAL